METMTEEEKTKVVWQKKCYRDTTISFMSMFGLLVAVGLFLPLVQNLDDKVTAVWLIQVVPEVAMPILPAFFVLMGVSAFLMHGEKMGGALGCIGVGALSLISLIAKIPNTASYGIWIPLLASGGMLCSPLLAKWYTMQNPNKRVAMPGWITYIWPTIAAGMIVWVVIFASGEILNSKLGDNGEISEEARYVANIFKEDIVDETAVQSDSTETTDNPKPTVQPEKEEPEEAQTVVTPELEPEPVTPTPEAEETTPEAPTMSLDNFLGVWYVPKYDAEVTLEKTEEGYVLSAISVDSQLRIHDARAILKDYPEDKMAVGDSISESWGDEGRMTVDYSYGYMVLSVEITKDGGYGGGGLQLQDEICIPAEDKPATLWDSPNYLEYSDFCYELISYYQWENLMGYITDPEQAANWAADAYGTWYSTEGLSDLVITADTLCGRPYKMELFGYTQVQCMSYMLYGQFLDGDQENFVVCYLTNEESGNYEEPVYGLHYYNLGNAGLVGVYVNMPYDKFCAMTGY